MTCLSLATSLINHGLRNDEPSAVKDRKVQDGCLSVCMGWYSYIQNSWLHSIITDGHVPVVYNVGMSASSATLLQVYMLD